MAVHLVGETIDKNSPRRVRVPFALPSFQ